MHHRPVTYMSPFCEVNRGAWKHVNDTSLLHIDTAFQFDLAPIAAQQRKWPHIALWPLGHMTDERGLRMNECRRMNHRHHVAEGVHHGISVGRFLSRLRSLVPHQCTTSPVHTSRRCAAIDVPQPTGCGHPSCQAGGPRQSHRRWG